MAIFTPFMQSHFVTYSRVHNVSVMAIAFVLRTRIPIRTSKHQFRCLLVSDETNNCCTMTLPGQTILHQTHDYMKYILHIHLSFISKIVFMCLAQPRYLLRCLCYTEKWLFHKQECTGIINA